MAKIDMVEKEVQEMSKKLDRVLYILESDDKTNTKGIVEKTAINETRINGIDEKIKLYEAKAVGFGIAGAAVFSLIIYLIEIFIK